MGDQARDERERERERAPVRVYMSGRTVLTLVSGFGHDPWHIAVPAPDAGQLFDRRSCHALCGRAPADVYQGLGCDPDRWLHVAPRVSVRTYLWRDCCPQCFPHEERTP